jgi:hypothetical protein
VASQYYSDPGLDFEEMLDILPDNSLLSRVRIGLLLEGGRLCPPEDEPAGRDAGPPKRVIIAQDEMVLT